MKKSILVFLVFFSILNSISQNFEIPTRDKINSKEDYIKYENNVVDAVNWLMNHPIDKDLKVRNRITAFIFNWVSNNPYFVFNTSNEIATFYDSADCIVIFTGGMVKYSIENKDFDNKLQKNIAGVEAVIELYNKNRKVFKKQRYIKNTVKEIEKYIELKERNEFEQYIKDNL